MHKYSLLVLLILVCLGISFHAAYAVTGTIQIVDTNAPAKLIADRSFQLNVSLRITCTSTTDNILTRVDVSPHGSDQIMTSNSLGLGSILDPWGKKAWNITIANNLHSPATLGPWALDVKAWLFAGVYAIALDNQTIMIQVVTRSPPAPIVAVSITNSTNFISTSSSSTSTSHPNSNTVLVIPQALLTVGGSLLVVGIAVCSITVTIRRKRSESSSREGRSEKILTVPTGCAEVDKSLGGGAPVGHSIIIVSPAYDEKDLLIERIISSFLRNGFSVFFVSRQILRNRTLTTRFKENFYAFTPRADKIAKGSNIFKIMDVQNPNDFNISLAKAMEPLIGDGKKRLIILDQLVSDILLEHKALAARRWLDDFLVKRKSEGFTTIVTLNPLMVSEQQRQALIDLFDGVVVIYEKELPERSKRYLIIRKMYARKYSDTAIELDRGRLS